MIDEEDDDEEILKKGFTFKSALKTLLVVLLVMLGAYFMYLGFSPDQWSNFFLGILFLCLGTTLMQMQKEKQDPLRQTLTILICTLCNLTLVRNYKSGDFIFNKKDKCDKCNGLMEIKKIYSVKLKKSPAPIKKQETKKTKMDKIPNNNLKVNT
ncbi:MAG: hypothetical protein EU540_04275 [Promethearchaeota archaeon]|nr:MAG: hypothetical protein EU540_04275 [Candidatus Lokiarchaeota archaeon]